MVTDISLSIAIDNDRRMIDRHKGFLKPYWQNLNSLQKIILERLRIQDTRKVTWVVDPKGGSGKTILSQCLQHFMGWIIVSNDKTSNILRYIVNYKNENHRSPTGICFDYSRSLRGDTRLGKEKDFVNYQILELMKNGEGLSGKYDPIKIYLDRDIKILVIANFSPDLSKLSSDRWDIIGWMESSEKNKDDSNGEITSRDCN